MLGRGGLGYKGEGGGVPGRGGVSIGERGLEYLSCSGRSDATTTLECVFFIYFFLKKK